MSVAQTNSSDDELLESATKSTAVQPSKSQNFVICSRQKLRSTKRRIRNLYIQCKAIAEHRIRCTMNRDVHFSATVRRNKLPLGSGDGRWIICPDHLGPESVIYSIGIGMNITFDLALIERFRCKVHAFDPTPLAIEWLRTQKTPESFVVHHWGLAARDGWAQFALPVKHVVSFTMSLDVESKVTAKCPVYRLPTIRGLLGHTYLDLVKIDIEGTEYEVLDDLLAESGNIGQMLLEFHHRYLSSPSETGRAIKLIEGTGLRLFHVSASGLEYSFAR